MTSATIAAPAAPAGTATATVKIGSISGADIRAALLRKEELALLDVREEAPFATAHPLFAANLPLSRIELDAFARFPRRDTLLAVYDDGEGLAAEAAQRLAALGYTNIRLLEGGLDGWSAGGGEIFIDVNSPSKAFGELVESQRHTPSLSAQEVKALIESDADVVVLDARRYDEYNTMSIPGGISVPGAELVLRARALAPRPETQVIVNCAGRTRSIIGTQSLVNAGIPNPVAALRNGTIGWKLAGQALDTGKTRTYANVATSVATGTSAGTQSETLTQVKQAARAVADRAGVLRADDKQLALWRQESNRTTYLFDVRSEEEYVAGHLPGFRHAPGGQLVQETDHSAPVRGARIVLDDNDGVRANMTASWLAQMGWEVAVLDAIAPAQRIETGAAPALRPPVAAAAQSITPQQLAKWLETGNRDDTAVLDFTSSANYVARHTPGAWFVLRSQLAEALATIPSASRYVLTCGSSLLARYVVADLQALLARSSDPQQAAATVYVLDGGTAAWAAADLPTESGETRLASPRIDRYRRPYEGTDSPATAMQAYLDWEYGLVAQLAIDSTHGFFVI